MVTIGDIAKRVGVVKSTVSNVLSGKKRVSVELTKKIMAACKELNFQPNFCASTLVNGKTNIIALFLEQGESFTYLPFYNELLQSCIEKSAERGYNVLVYYGLDEQRVIMSLQQGKAPVDGAIILSPYINDERINKIKDNRIPCIVIGRPNSDLNMLKYVDVDNCELCYNLAVKLIKSGYNNICLINSKEDLTISIDRCNGVNIAIEQSSQKIESIILYSEKSSELDGYLLAKKALENKKIDVFITANEFLAMGVYKYLNEINCKIGKEIAVFALGCSGIDANLLDPPLSHAHQDYYEIGSKVIEMLFMEIENGGASNAVICKCSKCFTASCPIKE